MLTIDTESLFQKARAAYQIRDFGGAETYCRQVLAANPIHSAASLLFALICSRTNRESLALTYLRNLIRREPGLTEAHIAASGLLFKLGQAPEARDHARRAIELEPHRLDCYIGFAQDLARMGSEEESSLLFQEAVQRNAGKLEFLRQLADYLARTQRNLQAIKVLDEILALNHTDFAGWLLLGKLRSTAADFEGAVDALQEAVSLDAQSVEANLVLGAALAESGRGTEAIAQFETVLRLSPKEPTAFSAMGSMLQQLGQSAEANRYLALSAELQPSNGFARYNLIRVGRVDAGQRDELIELEKFAANPSAPLLDRSYLRFAAAKGWEDLGEYQRSMANYDQANEAAYAHWFGQSPWDRRHLSDSIDLAIRTFTPSFLSKAQTRGLESTKPVFVVGMPRSGTTLIEQVASSHPDIVGAGELPFWPQHAREAFAGDEHTVDQERLLEVGKKYLDLLSSLGPNAERVIDKLPHNFLSIGLICSVFPNARVIHIRRGPIDNCLSIYSTAFGRPPSYSLVRGDIVFAYREYQRIMAHWRTVLGPQQLLEVEYEDLIASRDATTRRMIEFLGVPWDESCLSPERNNRPVHTASMLQVRKPVYNTSVGRWRRFEPWIAEFLTLADSNGPAENQVPQR